VSTLIGRELHLDLDLGKEGGGLWFIHDAQVTRDCVVGGIRVKVLPAKFFGAIIKGDMIVPLIMRLSRVDFALY